MWTFAIRAIKNDLKEILLGILAMTLGLSLCFAIYVLAIIYLLGDHKLLISIFLFLLIPVLSILLVKKIAKRQKPMVESFSGMLLFYGIAAFFLGNYLESDYSQLLAASVLSNFLIIALYFFYIHIRKKRYRMKYEAWVD